MWYVALFSFLLLKPGKAANWFGPDGYGFEVFDSGLSDSDLVFWYCECGSEFSGHDEVSLLGD